MALMQYAKSACDMGPVVSHARWQMLIVVDCLTGDDTLHVASLVCCKPLLLQLLCVQSQRDRLLSSVWTVGRVWWRGCNYRWMVRLHGCIARRWWHFFRYLLCDTIKHTAVCHINTVRSLFTITFHYTGIPKWSKNCTKIVHRLVPK